MSPFKEHPVKWDGEPEGGRYENRGGYKYDIVAQQVVVKTEDMPKCLIADTVEEAESLYSKFEKVLNSLAYSYHISTNIPRLDLFHEAIIGLGRAYRDWDPSRSDDFRTYALFRIKDSLNEFVRSLSSSIHVPDYIRKAHKNINLLKEIYQRNDLEFDIMGPTELEIAFMDQADFDKLLELTLLVEKAAIRAKVDLVRFVERIEYLPENVSFSECTISEEEESDRIDARIIVDKLRSHMDEIEISICEGIMLDKSYEAIGADFGKSKAWVTNRIKKLQEKLLTKVRNGEV